MNNQDPFAFSRPVYENEKPESPSDDPFFSARPDIEKKKYKQPPQGPVGATQEALPGGKAPWYEKFGQALALQSRTSAIEPKATPTALKAGLSGATLGASELIPGLEVEKEKYPIVAEAFKMGVEAETIGLLNKAFGPLAKLAQKSPIAKQALTSLAEITGWGLTGATEKTLTEAFKGKMPSAEDIITHGAEWAGLDAILKSFGLVGKFGNWILKKAKKEEIPSWQVVNNLLNEMKQEGIDISQEDRVTAKVLSEFEKPMETAKKEAKEIKLSKEPEPGKIETAIKEPLEELEKEKHEIDLSTKKIEPKQYEKISGHAEEMAKHYTPKEIDSEKALQELEKSRAEEYIEKVGERAETEKKLGESVQQDIENNFKEQESIYEPLYKEVETTAENIEHTPTATVQKSNEILEKINSLKTKPEGYQKVVNTIKDVLSDLNYKVVEFENKFKILDPSGKQIPFKNLIIQEKVPLSKSMELAKRLNKIIDYDLVGPSIKKQLKLIVRSLKDEIKQTLKKENIDSYNKFINAESKYAETAEKFGNETISNIRYLETPEKFASKIIEPSTLENLQKVLSPKQYNQVEREILEHLKEISFEKAKKIKREIEPFLSKNSKDAANSIIQHKSPSGKFITEKTAKIGIINELNKAFTTGKRPEKVLDLWKTLKGQKLIEESLKGTPNKKEILDYLTKQSFYDFTSSVIKKDGIIDFKKFNEYLSDPATLKNLKMIGGENAIKFFKSLENISKSIKFNVNLLEKLPKVNLFPKQGIYLKGEEKLIKGAERIKKPSKEVEKFKKIHPEKEKLKYPKEEKEKRYIRGEERLKEAAKKREPIKFKFDELSERYGFSPTIKGVLTTLGIIKFTGPALGVAVTKILYKIATRKLAQKSIKNILDKSKQATKSPYNIMPFVASLSELDEGLED